MTASSCTHAFVARCRSCHAIEGAAGFDATDPDSMPRAAKFMGECQWLADKSMSVEMVSLADVTVAVSDHVAGCRFAATEESDA